MTHYRTTGTASRLIASILPLAGPSAELAGAHEREWASATFSGARHCLDLRLWFAGRDDPLPASLLSLPEHEFDLPAEIVADCTIAFGAREHAADGRYCQSARIELLTIAAD